MVVYHLWQNLPWGIEDLTRHFKTQFRANWSWSAVKNLVLANAWTLRDAQGDKKTGFEMASNN